MLRAFLITIALIGCGQASSATPNACGVGCTISSQCGDIFSRCNFCSGGFCSSTLPAQPTTAPDAGIDAQP